MSFIKINQLNKTIKGKEILKDITISFEKGKIHGIFGRNGSGKTMLFRAICSLIKPSSGTIEINGKVLDKDISFPESVGVIIESPGFWPHYTGFENLKTLASIKNIISDEEINKSIERVGLDPNNNIAFKKYSLGMKQRLAIAQAVMERPDLLILDEPTNAIDEEGISIIRDIILEEKARGATILIASHNKEDIEILADCKYRMEDGRIKIF
ncbi:ATP-binding cassette domain-containing protein [Clostridium estertheticum]|uniref:ATP-binding cassette domain-containing protein n=1 Tax=Clostridium estertheticum TaxID=238834 RepID=UPI001C7D7F91|nr:ATP-binding cassette domain-containing protein [Clostridium estertheticum]MBX4266145.1 ATP-binding cassette domain-containing protein [Clostridium estertheticum]WLC87951.1 ATP-binding cassette domain-containing protein [Clostridium estertheticum]